MTQLQEIKSAIQNFSTVQQQFSKYGACDSEPCHVFADLIRQALKGKEPTVPFEAEDWELYSSSMNCNEAAKALHDAAKKVVDLLSPVGAIYKYVKGCYF